MEKFNNHGLDAINSRVCMASSSDENNDEGTKIHHIKSKQVYNRDYTKEYLDYLSYLKKVYNIEELTEEEEKTAIFLLNVCSYSAVLMATESIPAKVIKHFCKAVDNNKKLPELYRADKSEAIEKLCIRFEKENGMPQNSNAENISMEYLGYYDSEVCQIILCPERIKNAPTVLEEKGIHHDITSQALYGMVFIHALSHALLDMISKIDTQESRFMDESIATMMTLFYYLQTMPDSNQYKTLLEWFPIQSNACMAGLEQFKMFENDKGLMKKYWAAWMERKSKITQK